MPRFIRERDEGNAILLGLCIKACYDNPLFEEDAKQRNDYHPNGAYKKHHSNDYCVTVDKTKELEPEIRFQKDILKRRKLCIVVSVIAVVAVLALIIGLILNYTKDERSENTTVVSMMPSIHFSTDVMDGRLRIIKGPFSVYREDYKNQHSDAFILFSVSFAYKMKSVFSNGQFSSIYNRTVVNSISSDSIVSFTIHFNKLISVTHHLERTIQSLISASMVDGLIVAEPSSVVIVGPSLVPTTTPSIHPDGCQTVTLAPCINQTTYSLTKLPNIFGHNTQEKVSDFFNSNEIPMHCYEFGTDFWCSVLNPECKNGNSIPPCRSYCFDVKNSCVNTTWPLDCISLPESDDPNICRQNPYKPGKCMDVPETDKLKICKSLGFNRTAFPNVVGNININNMQMQTFLDMIHNINAATRCYEYTELFACSVYIPKCSGTPVIPHHIIPPCKSLCQAYKENCFVFWEIFAMPWPQDLNCSSLPDSDDTSVCIGYKEANEIPPIRECDAEEAQCDTDRCIAKSYLCDGYQDCLDNSDESFCAQCPVGKQRCAPASSLCIDQNKVCDGHRDCYMAAEENMCIKLENGTDSGRLLVHNAIGVNKWEEVCSTNWNISLSMIVCSQLGYNDVIAFEEIAESSGLKSTVTTQFADSSAHLIQSYLVKSSRSSCPNGKVVKLRCGNPECGTRPAFYPSPLRVVNGDEVNPGTWPFMVELLGGRRKVHFCGAAVIGQNWVITAAHCLGAKSNTDGIYLNIAETRRFAYSKYRQIRQGKAFYVHPDYSSVTVEHDIALIELNEPIYFNDYVRPVCLPDYGDLTPVGTRCYVAGWGKTGDKAPDYEPALMEVNLDVVNWQKCKKDIEGGPVPPPFTLTSDMMCAGGGLDHDACSGDSGGPLLCPVGPSVDIWRVTGIVSWGLGCAVPNKPGVYTQVSKYASWIRNVTRNEVIFV